MTPKLMDRLTRLESLQVDTGSVSSPPREVIGAWLRAIAIALGGYPRPRNASTGYTSDTLGDGFARALGYADRQDMEACATADADDWLARLTRAEATLCEKYAADAAPGSDPDAFSLMCAALNEWAGAKASRPDWPKDEDDSDLARALAFYGVPAEAQQAEGRR